MLQFLLRRFLQSLLSLFLISLIVFVMMFAVGDPLASLLPPTATQKDREILREELGLNRPILVQYAMFMGRAARGDFGISYYKGQPVLNLILERAPATLELATVSMLIALLIGVPLGILAGARPHSWGARASMWGSMIGISLPTFWLGLLLMMYFGVKLEWLPPMGRGQTREIFSIRWSVLTADGWAHLILPGVTLALHHLAMLLRLVRSQMLDTLQLPFIRVARSKGVPERSVIGHHALRNTLIPIVTVTGVEFGQLLAFSVVTETIFQWPGLGKLLIESIYVDRPLVIGYIIMTGIVFLGINFFVDLLYALLDPRIRLSARGSGS
ncbi:ABC transporter permease [Candidatus Sumerlaeota bacterium]|nr:ABC transporter permease [Candidatus Sumerlaeota bacterium]